MGFFLALLLAAAVVVTVWRLLARPDHADPFKLSLCLLVCNQVDRVEGQLAELLGLAERLGACITDVLLADAGSTDGTAEVVRALGRRYAGLKVLCWPEDALAGQGVWDAIQAACEGRWVLVGRPSAGVLPWREVPRVLDRAARRPAPSP